MDARDLAEIERSALEAQSVRLVRAQVERYLDPAAKTPYPLEYAFHLLGDVKNKTVLDLGCGTGDTIPALAVRAQRVIGMDNSPDLIALAERRLVEEGISAGLYSRSAYETELPDRSVDAIFCMSLLHHLEISRVMAEMRRILRDDGFVVIKEPIRFSKVFQNVARMLPKRGDVSEYEHPFTEDEFAEMTRGWDISGLRYFRVPFVSIALRLHLRASAWKASDWMLNRIKTPQNWGSVAVMRLAKAST